MILLGEGLKNIPFEEKPISCSDFVWRYSNNPIIKSDAIKNSNSIFNSAVIPFKNGFAGVFRCDSKSIEMNIYAGFSENGIDWEINEEPIDFKADKGLDSSINEHVYKYDPRVCKIGDKYYIQWCNGYKGFPTIGIGWTKDFKNFYQMENALLPFNRNGVLFKEKIGGQYAMLSRPSDSGHTPFGDIFLSYSDDLVYWGKHRYVFGPSSDTSKGMWATTKVGAGPTPILTDEGYILIYHGVITQANGMVYSFGAVLLDKNDPSKVLKKPDNYLIHPKEIYERVGDVPNVCFPCATLQDADTGRIAIYYGCADTVTSICFTTINDLSNYLNS